MSLLRFSCAYRVALISLLAAGCQNLQLNDLKTRSTQLTNPKNFFDFIGGGQEAEQPLRPARSLSNVLNGALADRNEGTDFATTLRAALENDPLVITKRKSFEAKLAAIDIGLAKKDYQVSTAIYGGIEDVTDKTKGVAVSLNASRLIFDGGLLDAQVAYKRFEADAAKLALQATVDDRAYSLGEIWLELERYEKLKGQIDARLAILDPLIEQLEQVAKAGIGDVSKVTAAQRTVSSIRVTQTTIYEGLEKARLDFLNSFGSAKKDMTYDPVFIEGLLPAETDLDLAKGSPVLLARYAKYNAHLANLEAIEAKKKFNIGFEAKAMKPMAGSEYESDESIGFVARKTLFSGGMIDAESVETQALADSVLGEGRAAYRKGVRTVRSAEQSIESMNKAISLAKESAAIASDEIIYLRQQLVIGASTLDNVLAAEARLYEAESQEIHFVTERRKAQLLIASTLGLISLKFDL